MKTQSFFKLLFWFIVVGFISLFTFMAINTLPLMLEDPDCPIFMPIFFCAIFLVVGVLYTSIAVFVYRDAPKRGMKKWMWMVIATFVPNLIGLIIYVVVRSGSNDRCINCGKPVKKDFEVCPYCSTSLNVVCTQCGKKVGLDWRVCPYCKSELTN